ncbi:MAG: restriction endonuclease subunit S [Campylobacter sp.]|nr:restriction endonuclease subunit S [Campylobacter sp.]
MSNQNIEFKDSQIAWIGQIPKHWEVTKINHLYSQRNQKVSDKDFEPLSVTKKGILPQLENAAKTDNGDNRKLVKIGDFVINSRSDRRGSCGISSFDGSVSLINIVLKPRENMNSKYFDWLFHTTLFADEFYKYGNGIVDDLWSTRWDNMKNILVPYPPLNEQKKIAEFLDKKCEIIDKRLNNLERKIKSLKEYKKSLISECVTKGLNPKNKEFKDSGIPWIGQIPKHWEIRPLYFYFNERKNKNLFENEKNLLSLSYGKIIRKNIETKDGLLPENFNGYNIIEKDDIVFRLTDLQNDKVSLRTGLVKEKGIITSAYVTIKPKQKICIEFYHYLLHCYDLTKVFYNFGNGVRQNLTYKELSKMKILVPPLNEQKEIAEFLDKKCEKIDRLNENYTKQIATLKEYKKSLIYECVTGKKEI